MSDKQKERVDAMIKQDGINNLRIQAAIAFRASILSNSIASQAASELTLGTVEDLVCEFATDLVIEMEKRGWLS